MDRDLSASLKALSLRPGMTSAGEERAAGMVPEALEPELVCAIFNGLGAGVVICDAQGTVTMMNPLAQQLLRPADAPLPLGDVEASLALGGSVQIYEPGCRTPLSPEEFPLRQLLAGASFHDREWVLVHPQGPRHRVLASGGPLVGARGQPLGAVLSLYDITEHSQTESARPTSPQPLQTQSQQRLVDLRVINDRLLQEVERRRQAEQCIQSHHDFLPTIFDAEPVCIKIIAPDGQLQFINQSGLALLDLDSADEIVEQSVEPPILPEWRQAFWDMHQRVCAGERGYLEFQIRSYQGRVLWMEAYGAPLKDPISGQVMHLLVAQNITLRKQAEQALQNSEHLFSTVANASPAMIWMNDTANQRIYVNRPWLAFRGRTLEEELGQGWIEGLHPDDRDSRLATMATAMAAHQPYSLEYRLQREDGQFRWVVDRGQPHHSPTGQYLGYIGTCMDVTEHRYDAALLRRFFDLPFLGMVIYDPRREAWVRFNQHFCTMLGYSPAEMANLSWQAITHPEDVIAGVTHINRVLSQETKGYTREKRFIHRDGSVVNTSVDVKGIRDAQDQVEHLVITIQDITAYKQATDALRQSEERFRATFEQAAVGIAHVAPDGTWLWVNQTICAIVGYSREELLHLTFQDITHPDDLSTDLGYVQEMLAGERQSYTMEKRYIRKDRSPVWINLTVSLMRDANQQPEYFISIVQDISLAKQAQDTLRRYAQRLQGLHTMDRAILSKFRPQAMAEAALTLLHQLLGCERGLVALFHTQIAQADVVADTAEADHRPAETRWPLEDFVYGQGSDQPLWRIDNLATLDQPVPLLQGLRAYHQRSVLTVPLRVDNRVIGEITLSDPQVAYFQADHEAMAQETANHLAIALQNACLFEQVQADRQRLQDLSTQLLDAQEAERRWLAHELHDEVGQALTAIKLNLQRLQRLMASDSDSAQAILEDGLHLADGALQQVRNLSLDLRPSLLDDLGLVPALRWYVSRHADRTGLAETLSCDLQLPTLPPATETACFRIVQEALTNIARHAQARQVTVRLARTAQRLCLTIQDDGVGFDRETIRHSRGGASLGLLGMVERAQHIGGQLSITSRPSQGTKVELQVPLGEGDHLPPETRCAIFSQDNHGTHYPDHCR